MGSSWIRTWIWELEARALPLFQKQPGFESLHSNICWIKYCEYYNIILDKSISLAGADICLLCLVLKTEILELQYLRGLLISQETLRSKITTNHPYFTTRCAYVLQWKHNTGLQHELEVSWKPVFHFLWPANKWKRYSCQWTKILQVKKGWLIISHTEK